MHRLILSLAAVATMPLVFAAPAAAQEPTLEATKGWIEANIFSEGCDTPIPSGRVSRLDDVLSRHNNMSTRGLDARQSAIRIYDNSLIITYYVDLHSRSYQPWRNAWSQGSYTEVFHEQVIEGWDRITGVTSIGERGGCYVFELTTRGNDVAQQTAIVGDSPNNRIRRDHDRMRIAMKDSGIAERMRTAFVHLVHLQQIEARKRREAEPF